VALLGKRVYHGTLDNQLIAIDVATGRPVWDVQVADPKENYSMTAAPLAVKDKVIVGVAGGELGIRGFLDAYDAETGKRAWRFYTIPGPGEAGHETWENDAWQTGGGGTWVTGAYDPELNLLYWGVGNPAPRYDGDFRPGDNLYTCSVIALDLDTGQIRWHYQFVPHDTNDWDANIVPILADLEYQGAQRKLLLWANRNCFYYVLDRETGQFLQATEYCKQSWNDGFTAAGRPIRRPNSAPSEGGTVVHPGPLGGSNWYSPAFSPLTNLYYVNYLSADHVYLRIPQTFSSGQGFPGGTTRPVEGAIETGGVRAIHAISGDVAWESQKHDVTRSGILVTAAGLVFTGGGDGALLALDAATGEVVSSLRLGAEIRAGPTTYLHDGKQQLAVVAGGSLFVFEAPD
jgi:alcohol dehydrogenase (cytochrome c)